MNKTLRERIIDYTHGQSFSETGIEAIVREELLAAAESVENMHGVSSIKIAAAIRKRTE